MNKKIESARIINEATGLRFTISSSEELFGNMLYTTPHNTTLLVSKGTVFEIEIKEKETFITPPAIDPSQIQAISD